MTEILSTLVAATTVLVIGATAAHAQDGSVELDSNDNAISQHDQKIKPPGNKVVRYSAGDSILLEYPQKIQESKPVESAQAKASHPQTGTIRYSAGDSIPLGYPQGIPGNQRMEPPQAKESHPKTKTIRYSAGDSIPLEYPQGNQVKIPVKPESPAQKKPVIYSAASSIPLAGAIGDSATTHIGLSQPGLAEKNSLINTSPAGLVGLLVVKAGIVYYFDNQSPAIRKSGLKTTAGVWSGITMNNLLLIAGSSNPVSLVGGGLFGAYMYHREGMVLEKEEATKTAQIFNVQAK
ncbi:hypothetical protein [Pantoea sp. 18069]|uniref:hypothetical protein n=1 Tax=Pantoea sp. 18069 TaxID=2681415 RepID=UPI001357EEA1|nr:hypothetical protein [Pantoea sp. 18069]